MNRPRMSKKRKSSAVSEQSPANPSKTTISKSKKLKQSDHRKDCAPEEKKIKQVSHLNTLKPSQKLKVDSSQLPHPSTSTVNEVEFPRGGGIPLTAYELAEARRDGAHEAERNLQSLEQSSKLKSHSIKRNLSKSKNFDQTKAEGKKRARGVEPSDDVSGGHRIEHLSHKRLFPGIKLAGMIIQVRPLELIVSLPSQLVGHVPITEISSYYTRKLEELAEEEHQSQDSNDRNTDEAENSLKGLNEMFSVGQWIRCSVLKTTDHPRPKVRVTPLVQSAMRVTLTLDPSHINSGIDKSDLQANLTLTGAVKSVEDRGYMIDLGVPIDPNSSSVTLESVNNVTAFVSFADAAKVHQIGSFGGASSQLEVGQVIWCRVKKLSENGATCLISVNAQDVRRSLVTVATSVDSILPLHMVSCLVSSVTPHEGLNVNFLGFFKGSIDVAHIQSGSTACAELNETFKVGQKLRARVLWDSIPAKRHVSPDENDLILEAKVFSLSLLDHVIELDSPGLPPHLRISPSQSSDKIDEIVQYPIGYIFQTVRVFRVEEEWGLYLTCVNGEDGHPIEASNGHPPIAFAHIGVVSDNFTCSLSPNSGPYKIGSTHKARVTGVAPIDGILQVSLQPSLIDREFMRCQDIPVGEIIYATIAKVTSTNLFLKIDERIDAIVWPAHYSDVKHRRPEKKFLEGTRVKARVLYTDSEKDQVTLTLRRTFLQPDIEIITSYQSARLGAVTYATVKLVKPRQVIVEFFGRTRAKVPISEIDHGFVTSLESHFEPGQLIQVKIIKVNIERRQIVASIKEAKPCAIEKTCSSLEVGHEVSAIVKEIRSETALLDLRKPHEEPTSADPAPGLIRLSTIARQRGLSLVHLKAALEIGHELKDLFVQVVDKSKNLHIVNFKTLPTSELVPTSPFEVEDRLTGVVCFINKNNVVLHLRGSSKLNEKSSTVEGFLPISLLAQHRKVPIDILKRGLVLGEEISGLQLIQKDDRRGLLIVGFPDIKIPEGSAELSPFLRNPEILMNSDHVVGRVQDIQDKNIVFLLRKEGTEGYSQGRGIISLKKVAKYRRISEEELRSTINFGDYVYDLIVRKKVKSSDLFLLGFTCDKSIASSAATSQALFSKAVALSVGDSVTGTVEAIHDKNVVLSVDKKSPDQHGAAPLLGVISSQVLAGHWKTTLESLKQKLKEGQKIPKLVITKMNPEKGLLILGFSSSLATSSSLAQKSPLVGLVGLETGSVLKVCIQSKNAHGFNVTPVDTKQEGWSFLIDFTDRTDDYDHPASFEKGSEVLACVIQIDNKLRTVYLSTRPTDLNKANDQPAGLAKDPPIRSLSDLGSRAPIWGFVQRVSPIDGLIVQVGTNMRAAVKASRVLDERLPDWKTKFRVGQLVCGRIKIINEAKKTLRMSLWNSARLPEKIPTWEDLQVGQIFCTQVRKIEKYGMFLRIPKTKISGLCHSSQIYDQENTNKAGRQWRQDFQEGMSIRASIIELDIQNLKIGFSVKPSLINKQTGDQATHIQNSEEEKVEGFDVDSDEDISGQSSSSLPCSDPQQGKQPTLSSTVNIDFTQPSLPVSTGFAWETDQPRTERLAEHCNPDSQDEQSTDTDNASETGPASQFNTDASGEQSVDELQNLLIDSPNSSQLWIRLMALYIQKADIQQARLTAQRALEAIHYREEGEKWKVWISLLNLENTYGTDEQFSKTFNEASVRNDAKTVCLKVAEIYSESGKLDKAEETYNHALKKFRQSSKVWSLYGGFCLKYDRSTQAADLLSRSLKSLPHRKHIKTITKFAQLEFKFGESERGRTLFEGLVATYPKRLDLWNVYIDLEIKSTTSVEVIRSLFSRILALKLNPKRTKSIFNKWLNFEKLRGDRESQAMVIQKAQAHVATLASSSLSNQRPESSDDDDDSMHAS